MFPQLQRLSPSWLHRALPPVEWDPSSSPVSLALAPTLSSAARLLQSPSFRNQWSFLVYMISSLMLWCQILRSDRQKSDAVKSPVACASRWVKPTCCFSRMTGGQTGINKKWMSRWSSAVHQISTDKASLFGALKQTNISNLNLHSASYSAYIFVNKCSC